MDNPNCLGDPEDILQPVMSNTLLIWPHNAVELIYFHNTLGLPVWMNYDPFQLLSLFPLEADVANSWNLTTHFKDKAIA